MPIKNLSEEELLAKLRFAVDAASAAEVERALQASEKGLIKNALAAEEARKKMVALHENAEKLHQIGIRLGMVGAATMAPFLLAARTYNQQVGLGEETSRRWAESGERLKDAQIRLGRETTEVLLPLMEQGADLADKFASLIEKNPDLLKTILAVGGGMAAAGTVVMMIGHVQGLIAYIRLLTAGGGGAKLGGLALKIGGSAAGAAASAAAGGVGLGFAGYNAYAQATGRDSAGEIIGKYQTSLAYMWGKMLGGPELASEWGRKMGELTGVLPRVTEETEKTSSALSQSVQAQMNAYLNYARMEREATSRYQEQRSELIRNYQKQQAQEAAEFNRTRAQSMRDFYNSERQSEADFYRNRLSQARSYSVEAERAEEDFQRRLQQIREDWADQAEDLISSRDALGLARGMRDYERARRDAEQEQQLETSRRAEDFARQQAEQAEQFAAQRAQRLADFQQRMADEQASYDLRRRQAAEQQREQLSELQKNYTDERKKRRQALIDQLSDLAEGTNKIRQLWQQFTGGMYSDFQALMAAIGQGVPTRHSGGYTTDGLYRMRAGEFVLRPDVTNAAERVVGRSLNQDNMLAALANGGGRAERTIIYQDNRRFDSRLSSEDRALIRRDTDIRLGEVLGHG